MKGYQRVNKYQTSLYPKDLFTKLEFDKILELVANYCKSTMGKNFVNKVKIQAEPKTIERLLRQVHEFKQLIMMEEGEFPISNYLDLREELKLLAIDGYVLSEEQIFRIYKVLSTVFEILRYFSLGDGNRKERYPELLLLTKNISVEKQLINSIKLILDDDGKIRANASKELTRIRKATTNEYRDLERKFKTLVNDYKKRGWLTDNVESVRAGRRVLSVPAEHKRKVRGIIHDESNTGSTTFIEPEETLQISNRIVELQQAEKREIYRILKELSHKIRPFVDPIRQYGRMLGLFDFIRAKALFAWDINAQMPMLSDDRRVEIFNAKHPLLFLKNKAEDKKTVPLNLELSLADRILVVSGPNAGGKSVMLKTVGLIQLMFQAGFLVPIDDHSMMTIYRHFFVDIGDEQSIENDLSTYSSHLRNMRHFVEYANGKSLILIDEFGSGTDPSLGGAIAEALLEQLTKKFCYGIVTTHYSNLKVFATKTKGVFNGCMTFDYRTLSPKYKLEIGKPGSSFAFELATKSGLSKELIKRAKSKVDSKFKEFDELLSNLQREKQVVIEKERSIAKKEAELTALIKEYTIKEEALDKQQKEIILATKEKALNELSSTNKKFEKLIKDWNENKGEKKIIKQIKEEVAQDKRELKEAIEVLKDNIYYRDVDEKIEEGCSVRLRTGKEVGTVVELRKNRAVVTFGGLRTVAKVKELVAVEAVPEKVKKGTVQVFDTLEARSEFESNVDIRGMRRQEALQLVDELVDRALLFNIDELKIIHGIGDGILRRSIREMLRRYDSVKSVRDEDPQYGGAGVSIIELK